MLLDKARGFLPQSAKNAEIHIDFLNFSAISAYSAVKSTQHSNNTQEGDHQKRILEIIGVYPRVSAV